MGEEHDELLTINIGPHHPATHGVLRLLTTLEGEVVRDVKPIIGYVHTGIEKSCEDQQYWKVIPFVERMDYLSYYFNAMAFCLAVEQLLDEEVPPRAQWLRVIHLELNRIASHLFWIATGSLDIGAITMLWWGCRDRDLALDLFEMSGGQRFHTRYFQVGSVGDNYDRFRVRVEEMLESLKIIEQALDGLPEGPWITNNRKVALPPRHELATSMEALIHHFKLVTEGFRVPPGETYAAVESPRGELACFVVADGSAKPARVHIRDPSFVNLQALAHMAEGGLIADFITCIAMLDPILGGIDR